MNIWYIPHPDSKNFNYDLVDLTSFSHFKHFMLGLNETLSANSWVMMNICNCLNKWVLTGSVRIPTREARNSQGAQALRALQYVNFLNRKLFHPTYFFEVMGDLKQRTIS